MILRWFVRIFRVISGIMAAKSSKSWKKHKKSWYFSKKFMIFHDFSWFFQLSKNHISTTRGELALIFFRNVILYHKLLLAKFQLDHIFFRGDMGKKPPKTMKNAPFSIALLHRKMMILVNSKKSYLGIQKTFFRRRNLSLWEKSLLFWNMRFRSISGVKSILRF